MVKVMVINWISCGEGFYNTAVGTLVVCNVCCLFFAFVFQLGCRQVHNLSGYATA